MDNKVLTAIIIGALLVSGVATVIVLGNDNRSDSRALLDEELQIYGNANGDWRVDLDDVDYLNKIISGERESTKFADANKDGVVDEMDVEQVRALIDRTAQFIWLLDGDSKLKRIDLNISRVGCEYYSNTELMLILGLEDKVVAVDNAPYQTKDFYFGSGSTVVNMMNMNAPDYESIETLDLDVLLTFSYAGSQAKQDMLPDVDVIYLGMYRPNVLEPTKSEYFQGILKAGYIFGAVERAEAYMDWLLGIRDMIYSKTAGISNDEKPKVLMTNYSNSYFQTGVETSTWSVYTSIDPLGQACLLAGGHPVAEDILTPEQYFGGPDRTLYGVKVNPESIVAADIDWAFCHCVMYTFGGTKVPGPEHGYGVSDTTTMRGAYHTAMSREMVDIPNIRIMAGDFRNGASGCMLLALYMAKAIHPDLFEDSNPLEYHQKYVSDWMGIEDYDVSTQAVFIYPCP